MNKYRAILTEAGLNKLAAAALTGEPAGFSSMGVGDGGGTLYQPRPGQTGLINELYRAPLNRLVIADQGANIIRAEMVMFPQVGGFWLREAALYDDEGVCLAVANLPESYKPLLAEGSGRLQSVNLWIAVSNTADVELKADPSVIMATVEEVTRAKNEAKDYADELIEGLEKDIGQDMEAAKDYTDKAVSELDKNTKKAIADAVKKAVGDAWEQDNPVGTTRFFIQNLNPNERWPWSQWVYTGENKTIRVGKADGSNVGQTGGSDNVTLQRANLPVVKIDVSGETSELPAHELTTRGAGRHKHQGGMAAPGEAWDGNYIVGSDNDSHRTRNYTSEDGDHTHVIDAPPHKHSTSGKTDNLGEGKSFSVIEAHTLLMCWSRVA
ncbi:TPA: phage tail protein [Klebsiella pneumoniae]|uniref:phage tail protein n=1 Tax=Klebsiella pneumoniae TaxID=573 RepID=UPI0009BA7643|nr:phage tail protein [Klebsiella pneumoniae]HBR1702576.1 phage tail protein [Klebsiella pneumoniae]HBS6735933.1 phage tail protein [Klebsiella pneumoniae]HCA8695687.1 phage tail protein [Klebsiella pneumoniae]HCD2033353.1 phage tail protein [Klebsiella pneumoniae]HCI8406613.1 phage tail protein [Klebsiella pneumoniae]